MFNEYLREFRPLLVVAAGSLALSACASGRGGPVAYDPPEFVAPDPFASLGNETARQIVPGDRVGIAVFQVPDLNSEREVDESGSISMPLIGTVRVAGLTPAEAADMIEARLNAGFIREPSVDVTIAKARSALVTVTGGVMTPGIYPMPKQKITLMESVAMARGLGEFANPSRVMVIRTIDGQRMAAAFDLKTIQTAQTPDPQIYANDIVVVENSASRKLFGDLIASSALLFGVFQVLR